MQARIGERRPAQPGAEQLTPPPFGSGLCGIAERVAAQDGHFEAGPIVTDGSIGFRLTTFGRSGYLHQAMESGAVGFLLKEAPASELAVAIRRVMVGGRVIDPELPLTALSEGTNPLTNREREVLSVALSGASLADIAAQLSLSEGTVRNHLSIAIQKVGARNRMEAARMAEQKGWLEGDSLSTYSSDS